VKQWDSETVKQWGSETWNMKRETITIYVNDKSKELFFGLRVKNAIGARWTQRVKMHRAIVRDADGNSIDVDGALYDGERLYLAAIDPKAFADKVQKRA
jgi:hypothetical protein